jgi:hypothetical protein
MVEGALLSSALRTKYRLALHQIEMLRSQPVVFLLDGYDELVREGGIHVSALPSAVRAWPEARFVVTCRSGHVTDEAAAFGLYHRRELLPFTRGQVQAYIRGRGNEAASAALAHPNTSGGSTAPEGKDAPANGFAIEPAGTPRCVSMNGTHAPVCLAWPVCAQVACLPTCRRQLLGGRGL